MVKSKFVCWKSASITLQLALVFFSIQFLTAIIEKTPKEIEKKLRDHEIIPDVIEYPAKHELMIKYYQGHIPNFGNDLNPNDLEGPPFVVNFQNEPDEYFTILMIDPDYPSRSGPDQREWIHWMVTNMRGCSVKSGETLVKYLSPRPEQYTGPHRYIFLVFQQMEGPQHFADEKEINNTEYKSKIRGHFSTEKFITRNFLGKPYAATFFYSEWKPPRRSIPTTTQSVRISNVTYQMVDADDNLADHSDDDKEISHNDIHKTHDSRDKKYDKDTSHADTHATHGSHDKLDSNDN